MRTLLLLCLCASACLYDADLGPNCDLNCAACGTCEMQVPFCGDSNLDPGEDCDGGDDCDSLCHYTSCGNGALEEGESCDGGELGDRASCAADCSQAGPVSCGNGVIEFGEECDDSNTDDRDGCAFNCLWEDRDPVCGDGWMQPGEECDGGDDSGVDGCTTTCQIEPGWVCSMASGRSQCRML